MYRQEILHVSTNKIYLHVGETEIIPETQEYIDFQNSNDPAELGYIYVRDYIIE